MRFLLSASGSHRCIHSCMQPDRFVRWRIGPSGGALALRFSPGFYLSLSSDRCRGTAGTMSVAPINISLMHSPIGISTKKSCWPAWRCGHVPTMKVGFNSSVPIMHRATPEAASPKPSRSFRSKSSIVSWAPGVMIGNTQSSPIASLQTPNSVGSARFTNSLSLCSWLIIINHHHARGCRHVWHRVYPVSHVFCTKDKTGDEGSWPTELEIVWSGRIIWGASLRKVWVSKSKKSGAVGGNDSGSNITRTWMNDHNQMNTQSGFHCCACLDDEVAPQSSLWCPRFNISWLRTANCHPSALCSSCATDIASPILLLLPRFILSREGGNGEERWWNRWKKSNKETYEYAFWLPFRIQLMNAHFTVSWFQPWFSIPFEVLWTLACNAWTSHGSMNHVWICQETRPRCFWPMIFWPNSSYRTMALLKLRLRLGSQKYDCLRRFVLSQTHGGLI